MRHVNTPLRLISFALTGAIAGSLSCFVPRMQFPGSGDKILPWLGAILGLLLPAYLAIFEERRSLWRALVFLSVSTAAFYSAMMLALVASGTLRFLRIPFMGVNREDNSIMLEGGFVGAAILYLAYTLLYCRGLRAKAFFIGWPITALFGSWLALVAYGVGYRIGGADRDMCTLFIGWQAGMACLLGWLLIRAQGAGSARRQAVGR